MDYLARKISRAKWEITAYTGSEDIRADAITGSCLRTNNDMLSVWQCNHENGDVAEVVLALASAMEKIETIHIALLHKNILAPYDIKIKVTPENARTPVESLRGRHVDVVNLTMNKIVCLAKEIANRIRADSGFYLFTRNQVRDILRMAAKAGRITLGDLQDKVRDELKNQF